MNTTLPVLLCCLPLILQAAPLYKWKDANGRVIYSDYPPPVSQPGGVTQLNRQGQTIKKGESAEETAAREAASKTRQSQQQQQLLQQRNDALLLERYPSEREVLANRDKQLAQLEPGLRLLQQQEKKLQASIRALSAEQSRVSGKAADGLLSQLQVQRGLLQDNLKQQQARREEIARLRQQADSDSRRLQQLLSRQTTPAPAASQAR